MSKIPVFAEAHPLNNEARPWQASVAIYFPGLQSKVTVLLSGGNQSRAALVQQVVSTESQLVSSIPPALIHIWRGSSSMKVNIRLQHMEQKPRFTWDPSIPSDAKVFVIAFNLDGISRAHDHGILAGSSDALAIFAVRMKPHNDLGLIKLALEAST